MINKVSFPVKEKKSPSPANSRESNQHAHTSPRTIVLPQKKRKTSYNCLKRRKKTLTSYNTGTRIPLGLAPSSAPRVLGHTLPAPRPRRVDVSAPASAPPGRHPRADLSDLAATLALDFACFVHAVVAARGHVDRTSAARHVR